MTMQHPASRETRRAATSDRSVVSYRRTTSPRVASSRVWGAREEASTRIGIVGRFGSAVWSHAIQSGLRPLVLGESDLDAPPADVLLISADDLEDLSVLANSDVPIVARLSTTQVDRIAELIDLGVSKVLLGPTAPSELIRQLKRVARGFRLVS